MALLDRDREENRIVGDILVAVERTDRLSQRQLATQLGVALGLVNTYLNRCVKKGWIKVTHAPARRFAYYLTPQGFAEKTRLTAEFLSWSFQYFRRARNECTALTSDAADRGWTRIGLIGAGELAEIAMLCASESGLVVDVVLDADYPHDHLVRVPVARTFDAALEVDGWLLTAVNAQAAYDALPITFDRSKLLIPALLSVQTGPRPVEEAP